MNVSLHPATYDDKAVLARLLELYHHDMSEFYPQLEVNEHGLYQYQYLDHYWVEVDRYPYLIRGDGKLAGFVLVRRVAGLYQIAEFFVLRGLRGKGIGRRAAQLAFASHHGRWEIWHARSNTEGAALWRSVVPASAIREEEGSETVYRFETLPQNQGYPLP